MKAEANQLRAYARECRGLAASSTSTETHDLLLELANDLEEEAGKLDDVRRAQARLAPTGRSA